MTTGVVCVVCVYINAFCAGTCCFKTNGSTSFGRNKQRSCFCEWEQNFAVFGIGFAAELSQKVVYLFVFVEIILITLITAAIAHFIRLLDTHLPLHGPFRT